VETTKIKTADLLTTVQENRDKHKTEFEKALKKWRKTATKALRKAADKAEKDGDINQDPLGGLPKPVHYLKSYDTVIRRLQMEVEKTVELDDREFQSWVLDQWQWSGAFVGTTSLYNSR